MTSNSIAGERNLVEQSFRPIVISIHIPKCGGTSFRTVLKRLYSDRLWLNYGEVFAQYQARNELVPKQTACIHGHFLADAFDGVFPNSELVTWVRHPVQRVASRYYHLLRSPDMRDTCCLELHRRGLTLIEFAELDWMQNEMTRYLSGKTRQDFSFIGVSERFSESLKIFGEYMAVSLDIPPPMENVNPTRIRANYELTRRTHDRLLELNTRDMALYQESLAWLEERGREQPHLAYQA